MKTLRVLGPGGANEVSLGLQLCDTLKLDLLPPRSSTISTVDRCAIEAYMPDLIARHPAAADINVNRKPTVDDGLSIDLHPGAERFFQAVSRR